MNRRKLFWTGALTWVLSTPAIGQAGVVFTRIADSSGTYANFSAPALNGAGIVSFHATLDAGGEGIFTGNGGPINVIASTPGGFTTFGGGTAINDTGTVAFRARTSGGNRGVFTGAGGATTTIADDSGSFGDFDDPSINAAGVVGFFAVSDVGLEGIYKGDGVTTTTIATAAGPYSDIGQMPAIDAAGQVAFSATLDAGESFRGTAGWRRPSLIRLDRSTGLEIPPAMARATWRSSRDSTPAVTASLSVPAVHR